MENNKMETFRTPDTALAAWLFLSGIPLISIDKGKNCKIFSFSDSPELQELVTRYVTGSAKGNIVNYYRSYKALLAKIKE